MQERKCALSTSMLRSPSALVNGTWRMHSTSVVGAPSAYKVRPLLPPSPSWHVIKWHISIHPLKKVASVVARREAGSIITTRGLLPRLQQQKANKLEARRQGKLWRNKIKKRDHFFHQTQRIFRTVFNVIKSCFLSYLCVLLRGLQKMWL